MEWYIYLFLIFGGIATGFINTLAGSGSAVSLAVLDLIGLPLNIANATNRVAICLQNSVSVLTFKKNGKLDIKSAMPYALTAIPGGFCGAFFSSLLNKEDFRLALGIIMLLILISLFVKPKKWLEKEEPNTEIKFRIRDFFLYLFIGFYGGFIQVGVGVFLLLGLVLNSGMGLLKSNGIKVLFVLFQTIPSLAFFIYKGLINWEVGLILASGNMLGAWIGANEACKRGGAFIRYVLIIIVAYSVIKYLL